jgi:hypothetical protein
MNRNVLGLSGFLAVAALTASAAANAQVVTFDFTGTVTSSDLGWITSGTVVSGTYTINFGDTDLDLSNNAIGQPNWSRGVEGGAAYSSNNEPPETSAVFSSSVTMGSPSTATTTFTNSGLSAFGNSSGVAGGSPFYLGDVRDYTSATSYLDSSITLIDLTDPFGGSGLPLILPTTTATGEIAIGSSTPGSSAPNVQQIDYSITSLSRVSAPEINPASAASGLTLLLGGLAVLRGKRKAVHNVSA